MTFAKSNDTSIDGGGKYKMSSINNNINNHHNLSINNKKSSYSRVSRDSTPMEVIETIDS